MANESDEAEAEEAGRFDRAVAHWNARRFWHAHEDWEDLWNEAYGEHKLWLQGLIQYAAAFFHFERGFHASGFRRLMETATEKTHGYAGPVHHLDWPALQRDLAPWIEYARRVEDGAAFPEAPGPLPVVRYAAGYAPRPLPWTPDDDDAAESQDA